MKKIKIFFILILILTIQGCGFSDPKYINLKDKPNNSYYTNEIKEKLLNGEDYSLSIFNTDLYKNFDISEEEKDTIKNFISSLSSNNYKDDLDIKDKEPYQMKITFNESSKYILRIYDNNYISISPWDGIFEPDILTMEDIPTRYNLYDFCKYIDSTD